MKNILIVFTALIFVLGCARVSVQGAKEPIKLDISMRLDIYQHVEKDIDSIESIVTGEKKQGNPVDKQSLLSILIPNAFAQEGLNPEVEQAALRRKNRLAQLYDLEGQGIIGENKSGLIEMKIPQADIPARQLIADENSDRMIIYRSIALKNNISVEEVQGLYAKRLQNDAPAGTPIEALNDATGSYEWKIKR